MNEKSKELLDEVIERDLEALADMEPGSTEKSAAIMDLTALSKLKNDPSEEANRELAEKKKDRMVKVGIAAAELMVPLIFYGKWMHDGFKFEQTGAITSTTFRNLIGKFRPKK